MPWAWWCPGERGLLARCPSAMHSSPVRRGVPGAMVLACLQGLRVWFGADIHVGRWAGRLSGGSQG